tara:strand:- start:377 stop:1069 length:693 start_codon:yes stop_codon:yes gene_type:complete
MDYVEATSFAYDIANNIITGDFQLQNIDEIRLVLGNDVIMDHILMYLQEHYEDHGMAPPAEANNLFQRFIAYNESILENNEPSQPVPPPPTPPSPPGPDEELTAFSTVALSSLQPLNIGGISDASLNALPQEVQDTIIDPITMTIMSDPVTNSQGRTYDRTTIMRIIQDPSQWQGGVPVDPISRQPISVNIIIPNIAIRDLIQRYFSSAGGRKKQTRKRKSKKYKKSRKR